MTMLDQRFFQLSGKTAHNATLLQSYKAVYARSTMVLFSRKTRTPLAALTMKADDVGCLSMMTGRPSPPNSDIKEAYFQGMLNMPDQNFTFTISNLSDAGMINFNILHTPHCVSQVDPGPSYGVNEVNELHKNQSYTITADQRTNCKMILAGKTKTVRDPETMKEKKVEVSVSESESKEKHTGLYFYLSVVPDKVCKELVDQFAEGTIWKVVPSFVRKVRKPPTRPSARTTHTAFLRRGPVSHSSIEEDLGSGLAEFSNGEVSERRSGVGRSRPRRGAVPQSSRSAGSGMPPPPNPVMPPLTGPGGMGPFPPGRVMATPGPPQAAGGYSPPPVRMPVPSRSSGRGPSSHPFGGILFGASAESSPVQTEAASRRSVPGFFGGGGRRPNNRGPAGTAGGYSSPPVQMAAAGSSVVGSGARSASSGFGRLREEMIGERMERDACAAPKDATMAMSSFEGGRSYAEHVDVGTTQAGQLQYGNRVQVISGYTGHDYDYEHCSEPTVLCLSIWKEMKFLPLPDLDKELQEEVNDWVQNEGKTMIENLNAIYKTDSCVIDLESKPDTIICTCGHQCLHHSNVHSSLRKCPVCRSTITAFVRADGILVE